MKKKILIIAAVVCMHLNSKAQLLPSIGISSLPADTEAVCDIPLYTGSFNTSGLAAGDTAYDFKLYSLNGDSLVLSDKLAEGKPVLLIAGSLTCPVFLGKIPDINKVMLTYGDKVQVYVIYTVEAHPTDTSVYTGNINIPAYNWNNNILFPQPTTYGERKHLADTMKYWYWTNLNAPVFIDGPCNEWWLTYGPAPNNAYLIDTSGYVFAKHPWFHNGNKNIYCDIDSLLGLGSGLCIAPNGIFVEEVIDNNVSGNAGSIVSATANLVNKSDEDVTVFIKKLQKSIPASWSTAFYADENFSVYDDSVTLTLPAYDTIFFRLDFFTDSVPAAGTVKVGFRNENNFSNNFITVFGVSTLATAINEPGNDNAAEIYPNPATGTINISTNQKAETEILSLQGQIMKRLNSAENPAAIDISALAKGMYFVKVTTEKEVAVKKFIKE